MKSPAAPPKHRQERIGSHRPARAAERLRDLGRRLLSARDEPTVEVTLVTDRIPAAPLTWVRTNPEQVVKRRFPIGERPLLSGEDVQEQIGINPGSLRAMISFPIEGAFLPEYNSRSMRLYCFDRSEIGSDGKRSPNYWIMTAEQLGLMRASAQIGSPKWEDISSGIIQLSADHPAQVIGRGEGSWMPGLGTDTHLLDNDPELARIYSTISRRHAQVGIDESGGLYVEDLGSLNGTYVYSARPLPSRDLLTEATGEMARVQ
jgi:hypothetical protein